MTLKDLMWSETKSHIIRKRKNKSFKIFVVGKVIRIARKIHSSHIEFFVNVLDLKRLQKTQYDYCGFSEQL
jgi:hypothetical protein